VKKLATEIDKGSKTRTLTNKPESRKGVESGLDELHKRIQTKLDELHKDFRRLKTDLKGTDQASSRARKDRIEGFKQVLRDLLAAADRADREWH
jgi:hypothetical protein